MTSKLKLLTAFFVLSFAMMMGVLPFNIGGAGVMKAEAANTTGNGLTVTWDGNNSNNVSNKNNKLTISSGGTYTITGETKKTTVAVTTKDDVIINLNGVTISSSSASPIDLSDAGDVTITLAGTNTLTLSTNASYNENSGITVPKSGTLTITSAEGRGSTSGVLNVTVEVNSNYGTNEGAAIGSYTYGTNSGESDTDIIINGGTITATVSAYENCGSAIGNYSNEYDNNVNKITINGGNITAKATATSVNSGAAIGSYTYGNNSDESDTIIIINGGTIIAETSAETNNGSAIGSYSEYYDRSDTEITISGGNITAKTSGTHTNSGAAIGGYAYETVKDNDTKITINGGTITAETSGGHNDGPAIGVYVCDYESNTLINNTEITISDATIKAKATADEANNGPAIGVYTYGDTNFKSYADITINSGEITAETSGNNNHGSAIGAYTCDNGRTSFESDTNITINGGTITAKAAATGTASGETGVNSGSAIGVYVYGETHVDSDNNITINGGEITAVATATRYNYGSAIGGYTGDASSNESDTNITISGGTIKAYAPRGKAVKQGTGEVCILPDSYALNVKYSTNYDSNSGTKYEPANTKYMLCVAETDISGITGNNTYFYCSVDGTEYQISDNISVESNNGGDGYNVIVSVFGGDGEKYGEDNARYLKNVKFFEYNTSDGTYHSHDLMYYEAYNGKYNGNDAIVFSVESKNICGDATIIYALVYTYNYMDSENTSNNDIYYISKDCCNIGGVEA